MPKLDDSLGSEQAQAVCNAIFGIMRKNFDREMIIFACQPHVYELVLVASLRQKSANSHVLTLHDSKTFEKTRKVSILREYRFTNFLKLLGM